MAAPANENGDMGVVAKMAAQQDAELQRSVNDVDTMMDRVPYMSIQEVTAESMRVSMEIAHTQIDMEAKMGVVNSSKSAVETLMKNQ
jgi:type III secretion inner rod protein HrpB2